MVYLAIALTLLAAIGIWIVYVHEKKLKSLEEAGDITTAQLKKWLLTVEPDR